MGADSIPATSVAPVCTRTPSCKRAPPAGTSCTAALCSSAPGLGVGHHNHSPTLGTHPYTPTTRTVDTRGTSLSDVHTTLWTRTAQHQAAPETARQTRNRQRRHHCGGGAAAKPRGLAPTAPMLRGHAGCGEKAGKTAWAGTGEDLGTAVAKNGSDEMSCQGEK